jgi:hypothetical protein
MFSVVDWDVMCVLSLGGFANAPNRFANMSRSDNS